MTSIPCVSPDEDGFVITTVTLPRFVVSFFLLNLSAPLGLVRAGLPNKLIARRLEISEKTVKAHLTSVFHRIGVTDRTQAALWAERHGVGHPRV